MSSKIYLFSRLIKKYNVIFEVKLNLRADEDLNPDEYDDLGNPIVPKPIPAVRMNGAIIPPNSREIYESGGAITTSDRILYVREGQHPFGHSYLPPKTQVKHKGKMYYVEGDADFMDFADFYRYQLKGVSVFEQC